MTLPELSPEETKKINEAIATLDRSNPEQFTQGGDPRVDVVAILTDMPELTRAQIVAAQMAIDPNVPAKVEPETSDAGQQEVFTVDSPVSAGAAEGPIDPPEASEFDKVDADAGSYNLLGYPVKVTLPEPFEGEKTCAAVVVKFDPENDRANLRVFAPNGGADRFLADVDDRDTLTEEERETKPYYHP